jgi:hypothetical protein
MLSRRSLVTIGLGAVLLATLVGPARSDHEETEARLKAAGVSEDLSRRIHTAIERGVGYLRSIQKANGNFSRERWFRGGVHEIAVLAVLALRHAGTPDAMRGVDLARPRLFPPRGKMPEVIRKRIYQAGFALMILMADDRPSEHAEKIGKAVAGGLLKDSDWWGYVTDQSGSDCNPPNLSTSQFGGLGLWAAARSGVEIDLRVWRRHVVSLLATQCTSGSWPYSFRTPLRGVSYDTGTCMGLANVLLARGALREYLVQDPGLERRIDAAVRRGLRALDSSGPAHIERLCREIEVGRSKRGLNGYTYYNLYALEKACIFAGRERIGGVRWYVKGAETLIENQMDDGGWGRRGKPCTVAALHEMRSDILGTSFALLFLLRASETYHPVTPREIDRGTSTEPSDQPPGDPEPPAKEPADGARVELAFARQILARLEQLLRDPEPRVEDLLATLRLIDTAYHYPIPDADAPEDAEEGAFEAARDSFRGDVEKRVLAALVTERIARVGRKNLRSDVNDLAAVLLGGFRPEIALALRKAVDRGLVRARYEVEECVLYHAFEALLKLAPGPGLVWLTEKVITAGAPDRDVRRSRAAMDAIGGLTAAPARSRLMAVKRLVRIFEERERVGLGGRNQSGALYDYWTDLRPSIALAFEALARDPVTGEIPPDEDLGTVKAFTSWLRKRARPNRPPWRD